MSIKELQRASQETMKRAASRYRLERITLQRAEDKRESAEEIRAAVREMMTSGEVSA